MNLLNESINTTSGNTRTNAEYTLATIYYLLGDLNTSLKIYNNIKYKYEERGDNRGVAVVLHAIGLIHQDQGNYEEAVKKYNQSLKIEEKLGDKSGIAVTLGQLGMIQEAKKEYVFALQNYLKAFSIFYKLNSPYSQLVSELIFNLEEKNGRRGV